MNHSMNSVLLAAITLALSATNAHAQTASSEQSEVASGAIENIVITARRTDEKIQSTPVAVTAYTSAALEQQQVFNVSALQQSAPNLVVTTNHSGVGLSLRGQAQTSADSSVDQSVGLYVDGVYIARQMAGRFDLVDIERIEVLHGPQGTLFGRNTTGGAVNIITKKPTDRFEGSIAVGGGNYDRREYTGILNLPISDTGTAARIVARHSEHDGYGRNTFLDRDVADDDYDYVRGAINIEPADSWSLLLSGDYVDRTNNGPAIHLNAFNPALPLGPFIAEDDFRSASEIDAFEQIRMLNGMAALSVDIGEVTLKSISAYRNLEVRTWTDFDTTPVPLQDSLTHGDIDQVSEELQLLGSAGPFDWIAGLYYFKEDGTERYEIFDRVLDYNAEIKHESYAGYGQLNYRINDDLRATMGARYTKDDRELVARNRLAGGCFMDPAVTDNLAACRSVQTTSENYPSYTASLDYQYSPSLFLYTRTSMSRKSGGFNKTTSGLEPFDPEKVTDYEVGFKSDWFDQRLRLNVAAFIAYYENMQRPVTSDATGQPVALTQSVGKARISGAEMELTAAPISGLEINANLGVLDPKYTDFMDATGDRSDEPFTRVSKVTWSVGSTYKIPAAQGTYAIHADYGRQSEKKFFASPLTKQPSYGILNARASLELQQPNLELALWGRNLSDTEYDVESIDFYSAIGIVPTFPGEPRTYGFELTYRFAQ